MFALKLIAGALVGGFLGYYLGVLVACEVFQLGNLCGLLGVFITGPVGLVVGIVLAWWLGRRRGGDN